MEIFWAKGFEATSLDDLCAATRLSRSSLYAAFGDKQSLYDLTIDRYEEAAVERIRAAIAANPCVRAGISSFIQRIIDDMVAGPGRRGCFIGNCAGELTRGDRAGSVRIRRSLLRIELTFREALDVAVARGEIPIGANTHAMARFITAGIQGLRLVGKANPDRAALEDIARVMLRCLGAQ